MARIAGVDLPPKKRAEIGLTYIYGIGLGPVIGSDGRLYASSRKHPVLLVRISIAASTCHFAGEGSYSDGQSVARMSLDCFSDNSSSGQS